MMKNYRRFGLVRTGCYDLGEATEKVRPLAEALGLAVEPISGEKSWLEALLEGPHDDMDRFLTLPPFSDLNFSYWCRLIEPGAATSPISQSSPSPPASSEERRLGL
jgi:hypothetical protein